MAYENALEEGIAKGLAQVRSLGKNQILRLESITPLVLDKLGIVTDETPTQKPVCSRVVDPERTGVSGEYVVYPSNERGVFFVRSIQIVEHAPDVIVDVYFINTESPFDPTALKGASAD